jgi:beta-lactamase regulating signal transducer with metallopeptidase domain
VGWALIHSLWQGAALAALAWLALRTLRAAPAGVRYAVATAALGAMAVAPVATAIWLAPLSGTREASAPTAEAGAPGWRAVEVPLGPATAAGEPGGTGPLSAPGLARRASSALEPLVPGLVLGWAAGVLLLSLRLLGGWLRLQRLARRSRVAVPAAWTECLDGLRRALGIRRRVGLFLSPHVHGPALVGWLRPVILLPLSASSGLTPRQVELLLLHELVHVRRWDYAVNLLQRLAETLLFYHPGVWWVSARIREEREHCCDDAVVARAGVREYVLALLAMEEVRAPVPALALGAGGASLLARVRRLVDPGSGVARRAAPRPVLGVMVPALVALAAVLAPAPERAAADQGTRDASPRGGLHGGGGLRGVRGAGAVRGGAAAGAPATPAR